MAHRSRATFLSEMGRAAIFFQGVSLRNTAPPAAHSSVMAGLDPAIHGASGSMDAQIKSGHDSLGSGDGAALCSIPNRGGEC